MTRVLSELLGAQEPLFQQSLRQLESLSGHPQADIRLSTEIQQLTRLKLRELGLDGHDTTGPELYAALGHRLGIDEARFAALLMGDAAPGSDPGAQIARILQQKITNRSCFALKSVAAKKLLKANLPRKTMKLLGYRSADSMLKHESAASLFAAAWLIESVQWTKRVFTAYGRLQVSEFETRDIAIEHPFSKRWQELAETVVATKKHQVLSFKELGAVVLLPLPAGQPPLATLTATVLTIHALNEIRAAGTFLKLHQLQPGFGSVVQQVVLGEPMLPSEALDEPVSWHSLHQYFERFGRTVRTDIFEPVVAAEELVWNSVEHVLTQIDPALEFWKNTAHLGLVGAGQPVPLNLTDALLSHANLLGFNRRVVQYFKQSLRAELLLRYLSHDKLEQTVFGNLRAKLAPEMVGNYE
jgi:hypothetical protein